MSECDDSFLIVLLHGFNSHGNSMAPLRTRWSNRLPNVDFFALDGPYLAPNGRQWIPEGPDWSTRMSIARSAFDRLLLSLVAANGLLCRPEKVVLVGFSQGACMALDALATGRWPVGAVVSFSGRLNSYLPLGVLRAATPVLLVHGEVDTTVSQVASQDAAILLQRLGLDVALVTIPGLGHAISAEAAEQGEFFLSRILG